MKKLLLSLLMTTYTVTGYSADLTLSPSTIQYTNPADAVTDFNLLTGAWNASGAQLRFCDPGGSNMNRAVLESSSSLSGYTTQIDGVTYSIFTSNIPGVGWVMGAKDTNAPVWTPLTNAQTTVYPFGSGQNGSTSLGANVRFAFVKLPGNLSTGSMTFPQQKIADFKCYRTATLAAQAAIYVNATQINVNALACQVATAKNVSIPLGEFSVTELPPVNGNFGEYSTTVELSCDSGITPWMTVSDASNSANTSNIIQLTPGSDAQGVGVQVFYNNDIIAKSLGLDTSSKNNPNQFQVGGKTTTAAQQVSVPLSFKYIRTQQSVTPGEANAAATVTFSYQ